jgi:hypothetical protein
MNIKAVTTMKTRNLIKIGLGFLGIIACTNASAVLIQDDYWGSKNHGWGDVIGGDEYQVNSLDVTFTADYMTVRVNTNFSEPDPYGVQYGDLFISTNGWHPYGSVSDHYKYDDHSNGEKWEYVFDTIDPNDNDSGSLYGGKFSVYTSDDLLDASRYIFRNGQEVQREGGGDKLAGSSVDLANAGYNGYIEYNILLSSLNLTGDTDIGLKWGMTCANDTIEGAVHYTSVPEPSTILLFGLGLLGLGVSVRKKYSH